MLNETYTQEELYHWGIKGMKWGVRRFQNKDGSLTAKGRARYDDGESGVKKAGKKIKEAAGNIRAKKRAKITSAKKLTDAELNERIKRLELEKRYQDLLRNTSETSKGRSFVAGILETSGRNVLTQMSTYLMGTAVNKIFESQFGPNMINPKKGQKD